MRLELIDENGERLHWLEGDGWRFVDADNKVSTWIAAEISAWDADEEDIVRSYLLGYMRDYDERRP